MSVKLQVSLKSTCLHFAKQSYNAGFSYSASTARYTWKVLGDFLAWSRQIGKKTFRKIPQGNIRNHTWK
jgi:hypothetical protein